MTKIPTDNRTDVSAETIERGHELSTQNTRVIIITAIGITSLVVFALAASWAILALWTPPVDRSVQPPELAAPRLQEPPLDPYQAKGLASLRAEEKARLTSYRWLDDDRTQARIPIDRAMQLVAEEGVPQWQPNLNQGNTP